jgi:hypothetical protein
MKRNIFVVCLCGCLSIVAAAQSKEKSDKNGAKSPEKAMTASAVKSDAAPLELAKSALAAHGGDRLKNAKSIVQIGSVEISLPNSAQTLSASYAIRQAGSKSRFELNAPAFGFFQIYDGQTLYNSVREADLPPLVEFGLNLLTKIENPGYKVSALPEQKKLRSFRVTTPEGYATDFHINPANGQVQSYEVIFSSNGREMKTAVANDKFRQVEGVLLPEKFSQRLELPFGTFYSSFKAKEILINSTISDDVFKIPQ